MNTFTKQALAALVLAGVVAVPASANVQRDVQQAISDGNVTVSVNNGVATLTGYAGKISQVQAERAAQKSPEVERVVNLLTQG